MRVCDAAVAILRETDNPAVMWGDSGLLDAISIRAGLKDPFWPSVRWQRVLDALSRQPGILRPGWTATMIAGRARNVRIFHLPEPAGGA